MVVAMLTFRRHDDLREVLPALLDQCDAVPFETSVLIVDNDPSASAMHLAESLPPEAVRFVHEPVPGIAAARNRALLEAGPAELLVFIDDDERPEPGWLDSLVGTWKTTGAACVAGRVVSRLPAGADDWIVEGGFFERRSLPTGTQIDTAATNNLLLDMGQVDALGVRFDVRFGTTGGSDTLFTREIHRRGGRLVWCDEAVVVDIVPPSRFNREWVLRRSLRYGNSNSRTTLVMQNGPFGRLVQRLDLSIRGLARVLFGCGRFLAGCAMASVRHRARGARTAARGLGMVGGAWGFTYHDYRRDPRG